MWVEDILLIEIALMFIFRWIDLWVFDVLVPYIINEI